MPRDLGPEPASANALMASVGRGRPLSPEVGEALRGMLGTEVRLEGLSRLFQPGFPGVRTFAVSVTVSPDQAVELQLVGISREGEPVWSGTRTFVYGRDGSLEIHRGFDEIEAEYQSRNITVDLMQRELDILALCSKGPSSRLTIDAEHIGRYVCALHGFVFADETEEGPPLRSVRSLEPTGDRRRMLDAAEPVVVRAAKREGLGRISIDAALDQVKAAKNPADIAHVTLPGARHELADGDDGELGVGALGREFLLSPEAPPWRGALYLRQDGDAWVFGDRYRRHKTARSETRLAAEIQQCREDLEHTQRAVRLRALKALGTWAPSWVIPEIKLLADSPDRRIANSARRTIRQISWTDVPDRMLAFGLDDARDPLRRSLVLRVLAEHFPSRLMPMAPLLRVDPDARLQRAVVPLLEQEDPTEAGAAMATMLAANPWHDGEAQRPGLLGLRLELIERVARIAEPCTLPALMAAYRTHPPPPPAEMAALARALVVFPDPRAQRALTEAARLLERPAIP